MIKLCAIQINGRPRGCSLGNFPHPWGNLSLDFPSEKGDNPQDGILEKFGIQGWLITSMRKYTTLMALARIWR